MLEEQPQGTEQMNSLLIETAGTYWRQNHLHHKVQQPQTTGRGHLVLQPLTISAYLIEL